MISFDKQETMHRLQMYFGQMNWDYPIQVYERFAGFIERENRFRYARLCAKRKSNYNQSLYVDWTGSYGVDDFLETFEQLYDFLESCGYDEEQIKKSLATLPVLYRRNNIAKRMPIYEALGVKDQILIDQPHLLRTSIEELHARKMYMKARGIDDKKILLSKNFASFQKKVQLNLSREELLEQFPLTEETKKVFRFIKHKTDEELMQLFHLKREEILRCYPTTQDELKAVQVVGYFQDEYLCRTYGLTKEELFSKYPLNMRTLSYLRCIQNLKEEQVQSHFGKNKQELLHESMLPDNHRNESEKEKVYTK